MAQSMRPDVHAPRNSIEFLLSESPGSRVSDDARNAEIYSQGADGNSMYYIRSGRVALSSTSERGKDAIIAILGAGQFFGEACLSGRTQRETSAVAFERSVLFAISKDAMTRMLRDCSHFSDYFIMHLLKRASRAETDLVDRCLDSSETRLAKLLLKLAEFGTADRPPKIPVTLTHTTLAEMVGTTRSRICFFMNKFRARGYIDYDGSIRVNNSLALACQPTTQYREPHRHNADRGAAGTSKQT